MSVSEMMTQLIAMGHVSPKQGSDTPSFGSYRQVPSVTIYGNAHASAMIAGTRDAKLEQYPSGNQQRAGKS